MPHFRRHLTISFSPLLLLILALSEGLAAHFPIPRFTQDSVLTTTTIAARTDSLVHRLIPISNIGTIDRSLEDQKIRIDSTAIWQEYSSINDIVAGQPGAFVRELGGPGQFSMLTLRGLDGRNIAYLSDGVLLNEPLSGLYNPFWYQTEQADRYEFEIGTRAFLYGMNSTGGVINAVSKSYRSIRPRTRIRYSESTNEYGMFDGMFSQNLTRTLNLTGGVHRHTTDGRFRNSDFDLWGTRAQLRWDMSNRVNFIFTHNYVQTQLGLFGGVDYAATQPGFLFNNLQASVVSGDSYEKITRHDLRLTTAAKLLPDTTAVTSFTFYHSNQLREFRNEENRPSPDGQFIQDDHRTQWQGLRVTQHLPVNALVFSFGSEIQSRQVLESPATGYRVNIASGLFGKGEYRIDSTITIAAYTRLDNYRNKTTLSYGSDISVSPFNHFLLFAGYSRSYRFPTYQELFWRTSSIEGPARELSPEQHHLFEGGFRVSLGDLFTVKTTAFSRITYEAIGIDRLPITQPFPGIRFSVREKNIYNGVEVNGTLRLWSFFGEGTIQYLSAKQDGVGTSEFPRWVAGGGIYFWDTTLNGKLDLKLGLRGRLVDQHDGPEFNPEAMMFVPSRLPAVGLSAIGDGVLIARIGRAHIHLLWLNIFDINYIYTPFYPMPDRALRFGVTWELLD